MSSYQYIKGAISCSNATSYTGSFVKLQALNNTAADTEVIVIDRIEFGLSKDTKFIDSYGQPGTKIEVSNVFSLAENVPAVAGYYIEGPIAAFKVTSGGCLAYDTKNKS